VAALKHNVVINVGNAFRSTGRQRKVGAIARVGKGEEGRRDGWIVADVPGCLREAISRGKTPLYQVETVHLLIPGKNNPVSSIQFD
jgi:hypothetical protein